MDEMITGAIECPHCKGARTVLESVSVPKTPAYGSPFNGPIEAEFEVRTIVCPRCYGRGFLSRRIHLGPEQ